jgi:glycosyltransferase involved in cell wall biosynthesis
MKLSICIATYKRAKFIGETLRSVLDQLEPGVEVVVVDGASPDETPEVVHQYAHSSLRYFRQSVNSGFDADYDKAVGYARGEYCWLMTDDDLLLPGAISRVLAAVLDQPELVIVNAESRTPDLSTLLDERIIGCTKDRVFSAEEREKLFVEMANPLTFIGAVVIRRQVWMARDRAAYYGSLHIHVGVIFQEPPMSRVRLICEPLIRIRWGNAMWMARAFDVYMFKWPSVVWSFGAISERARAAVCPREAWRNPRMLGLLRALGSYSIVEYRTYLAPRADWPYRLLAKAIAMVPPVAANALSALYCALVARRARRELYDLAHGRNSSWLARWAARRAGLAR